jgi:outer membrane protein assembly factor BamB
MTALRLVLPGSLLAPLLALTPAARADDWPAWRGPRADGVSKERAVPVKWSATENVRWKAPLPGPGDSTPVVSKGRVFVTQATEKGRKRSLLCFDRKTGKLLWQKTVEYARPERTHPTNHYCSASPATDGERVVVSYGSAGVYGYDFAGKELWRRDLGRCDHIWGNASSPVLYRDLVLLNFGPGPRTFLVALNKKTGKEVWKVDEPGGTVGLKGEKWVGSWSTPVVATVKGRDELIMTWPGAVKAYDPRTGGLLWTCAGLEKGSRSDSLVYTSPLLAGDVVVAMAGFGGPSLAVRAGGKGDVTKARRLWRVPDAPQRIGTGVVLGEHVYLVNEPGTAQLIEWKTGKTVWQRRAGRAPVWASLVRAGDRLYVTDQRGETLVLAAGTEFEVLARNRLDEPVNASIAVSDGELFIRTFKHLWCIGKKD